MLTSALCHIKSAAFHIKIAIASASLTLPP